MENFFMSEAQAAREAEEEAARRRHEVFKPSSREGGSSFFSTSSTSSSAFSSSPSSLPGGVGRRAEDTAAKTATAEAAAAARREGNAADTTAGDDAARIDDEVDPLDMYMSSITEQVRQQDEETRQRLQREEEERAAAAAAAAAGEEVAGGTAVEGTSGSGQQAVLQRGAHLRLSSLSCSSASPPRSGSGSFSSSCNSSSSQRIFADDDDPLADSFEHVLIERQRAAEAQAARAAAQGTRKRKGDATDFTSDDEDAEEEKTKSKVLPLTDHSKWLYPSFVKDIYKEFKQIEELTHAEVGELKRSLQLRTFGKNVPRPIASFLHLKDTFSSALFTGLHKRGFSLPTPIQSAAIPCLLRGRDLLAVAETGSGKTAAYLIPLLARLQHLQEQQQWTRQHVIASDETQPAATAADAKGSSSSKAGAGRGLLPHGGPAALVICPTRELAVQLDGEVHALVSKSKKGAAALMLRRVLLAGGFDKTEQFKQLKQGVDLAICTPGRVIDTAATKGMQNFFQKVVTVVVDEADKLVDMGFELSLRNILHSVRPDRLTAMFSATFSPACEALARQFLDNPIKIIVGEQGQAAKAVEQNVVIVGDEKKKFRWLADNILSLLARPPPPAIASAAAAQAAASCEEEQQQGRVAVIFCNTQQRCEDLAHLLEEELSQLLQRQQEQQQQGGTATQEGGQATGAETATERDAASAAAAAPNTRTAAARLLQLETDDNPAVLKRNPHQTFKYSTVVHGGLNLTERLAAIRRLHQHILHPPAEPFSSPDGVAAPLLLIATDVASRGLDFPGALALVVSYDAPQEAEVYVHRIGRAGRAGRRGRSYALLTRAEKRAAAFIVESMRTVEQEPSRQLLDFAMLYPPFKAAALAGVKMQEPKKQSGKKAGRYLDNGLAGLGYSRDEAAERSSSPSRKKGKSVASLVARAAAAAAEALKQQQQAAAAAAGGSDVSVTGAEGFAVEGQGTGGGEGGTTAAAGECSSANAGAAETKIHKQQQPGGPKRGRWDSDEKKGSAPAGNTLDSMRAVGSGSSSLLHSTDSTGLNATGGSGTGATGKVVGIHDELSSDEDEAGPGVLLQQHRNPLQQQLQQQQQYYLPQQQQQQQQHYVPAQLPFQQPVETQQPLPDLSQQQRHAHEQPYYQQQHQQQPYSQAQQDLQQPHNAEVEAIVQQAAAAAAAAARAAAAQVAASKASGYAAFGSSSCHSAHASGTPAWTLSATGDLSYDDANVAAGTPTAPASIATGAGHTASYSARETATAAGFSDAGNASSLCASGTSLAAAVAGSPLAAAGNSAASAAQPKRSSVLNLEKREQRRKQWLVHAEARREQLRLQRTAAAQKEQQQRDPSPVRKSFSERPHSVAATGRTTAGGATAPGAGGGRGAAISSGHSAGNAGCVG